MNEETQLIEKPAATSDGSQICKVSVRAWLALTIVCTVCIMSALRVNVVEPLYSMGTMALGFYFGQKLNNK